MFHNLNPRSTMSNFIIDTDQCSLYNQNHREDKGIYHNAATALGFISQGGEVMTVSEVMTETTVAGARPMNGREYLDSLCDDRVIYFRLKRAGFKTCP